MFKYGRNLKLVGDHMANPRLDEVRLTKSQYADDAAVYEASQLKFVQSASKWGLIVSIGKTKGLVVRQLTPGGE